MLCWAPTYSCQSLYALRPPAAHPGASQHALAEETTARVTEDLFALNTLGPIKLTRAILPRMLARNKGRLVVVGSMSSKLPSSGQAVYSGRCMRTPLLLLP